MSLSIDRGIPASSYIGGFNPGKIQKIVISSDDMDKYGIDSDDFAKVDTNEDGLISASEFLASGIDISSIFNAFKQEATRIEGAYVDNSNNVENNSNNNNQGNNFGNPIQQQKYSLNHPSVANHPFLAQNLDFSA